MQLDLSRITLCTSFSFKQAAVAKPEGPAPTITGPGIQTRRDEDDDLLFIFAVIKGSCACFPSISLKIESIKNIFNATKKSNRKRTSKLNSVHMGAKIVSYGGWNFLWRRRA